GALRNRPEIVGVEARAANERAIDLGETEDRGGVLRVDRAAVKDARPQRYAAADLGVHRGDVIDRAELPGAYRPDRLVGNDERGRGGGVRDRAGELRRHDFDFLPSLTLPLRFADAPDRYQSRSPCGVDHVPSVAMRIATTP